MKTRMAGRILRVIKTTFKEFMADKVVKLSASLAYFTVFSLPPMLMLIIGIAGLMFDSNSLQEGMMRQAAGMIGQEAADQIGEAMKHMAINRDSIWATIVGVAVLVLSATGIFGEIQDSINQIWGLKTKENAGFMKVLLNRLLSFSLIVSLGFVLLVSLLMNAVMGVVRDRVADVMPVGSLDFAFIFDYIITFGLVTVIFAVIFRVLPDARIKWRDVLPGAVVTAIMFMGGRYLIGAYLGSNSAISAYGSAGSLVLLLLWVYYNAIILYLGAEFTQVYNFERGRKIEPNRYATWVEIHEEEKDFNTELAGRTKSH